MADSWKTDGNCNECRRQSYCGKPCTAHKNAIKNLFLSWLKKRGMAINKDYRTAWNVY